MSDQDLLHEPALHRLRAVLEDGYLRVEADCPGVGRSGCEMYGERCLARACGHAPPDELDSRSTRDTCPPMKECAIQHYIEHAGIESIKIVGARGGPVELPVHGQAGWELELPVIWVKP